MEVNAKSAWFLFSEKGEVVCESKNLPSDHVAWDPDKDAFPKKKCGVKAENAVLRLSNGETITGDQCVWRPKNPKTYKRLEDEYNELLKKAKK